MSGRIGVKTKRTTPIAPANAAHGLLAWTLLALIAGHVAMVLLHRFLWRDGTLARMAGRGPAPRPAAPEPARALAGAGRALDPTNRRLLAIDYVGADGKLDVPLETADQADAIAQLLDVLKIETLHAFVGYSYGALVGLQLAVRHPARLHKLVAVSGAHRAHPYAAAWRALQRKAVALGQLQCADAQGLSLARQFAMLSYRTPEEFGERFDTAPEVINGRVRCAAEDYLDAAGAQYVARTPVNAYLRLSESIDLHRIDPAHVAVPTVVVAVEGDRLVPLSDSVALVEGLGTRGLLRVLRSPYGHDAFLKETDRIDAILVTALRDASRNETGENA